MTGDAVDCGHILTASVSEARSGTGFVSAP